MQRDTRVDSVSVVIPCFNAGAHLDEAVRSALAQTHPTLEVVIVDDGSTDAATVALLDNMRWPRTRIFRQANAGPAAARNHAIREAAGDYVLPLDADDTIDPTYVAKAVAVLDAQPSVGCVYCKAMKFGAETGPWDLPPYRLEELVIDNVIFVTALFRKADWLAVGGFDEKLRHGVEDYDFWVKMVASGRQVVQLDEYLFNYRVQEKSRTTRFQDVMDGKVATYADIFRNNRDFYADHAESLFKHRFWLYAQIADWRQRYAILKAETDAQRDELTRRCVRAEAERARDQAQSQDDRAHKELELAAKLAYWRERYGRLDAFLQRHGRLRNLVGRFKALF